MFNNMIFRLLGAGVLAVILTAFAPAVIPALAGLTDKGPIAFVQSFVFVLGVEFAMRGDDNRLEKCIYALPMLGILGTALGLMQAFDGATLGLTGHAGLGLVFASTGYSVFLTIALVVLSLGEKRP